MAESLHFSEAEAAKLEPHLPHRTGEPHGVSHPSRPFVTLTFATSLDSSLALAPGTRTVLSGPQSKAMTHFLRSRHDAILVGVGTAVADDPGLNCRLESARQLDQQPRPIVVDPHGRWDFSEDSKVLQLVRRGLGLAPYVVTSVQEPPLEKREMLQRHGGKYIVLDKGCPTGQTSRARFRWEDILLAIQREGLQSVMIEGGGQIINSLLDAANSDLVDSVIVTIAPTWLGQGGVVVSPNRSFDAEGRPQAAVRLAGASWHQLGEDVVLCGKIKR